MQNLGHFVSQNLLFCISFILLLAIYVIFELTQTKRSQYTLSVADAVSMVNKNRGIYLDTRNNQDFKKTHIIGAHNISLDELIDKYKKIAKNKAKPVVIYGDNAEKARAMLIKEKFEQVYTLKGGLNAWLQASYPVKSSSEKSIK